MTTEKEKNLGRNSEESTTNTTDAHTGPSPEIAQSRETIRRLNRRVQSAEAGLSEKINAHAGQSFGRILANSAATMYAAQIEDLKAENARLKSLYDTTFEDWSRTRNDWIKAEFDNQRLRKLETRVFQFIAMGSEFTVEAFSDLAKPDTPEDVAKRYEKARGNLDA